MSHWDYLPFLLAWALPIIAIEWLIGGHHLWRERRVWLWVVLGLGVYFTLADAVAIEAGIWSFGRSALVGVWLGPVPIEEMLFYLLTAAMVVQGFVIAWCGLTLRGAAPEQRQHWLVSLMQRRRAARAEHSPPIQEKPQEPQPQAARSPDV